jgi:hypothetical protein
MNVSGGFGLTDLLQKIFTLLTGRQLLCLFSAVQYVAKGQQATFAK